MNRGLEKANAAPRPATIETNPIVRARSNPKSRQAAISAFCAHCMGCTHEYMEPGFREEIRNCTSRGCPLYAFRPYQEKQK